MSLRVLKVLKDEIMDESKLRNLDDSYLVSGVSTTSRQPFHLYSTIARADLFLRVAILSQQPIADDQEILIPDFYKVDSVFTSPLGMSLELSCNPFFIDSTAKLLEDFSYTLVR